MDNLEPTSCDKCSTSLQDKMWVQAFRSGRLVETVCLECDTARRKAVFRDTGRLSTWLVERAHLENYDKRGDEVDIAIGVLMDGIRTEIGAFEKDVWFGGLQKIATGASTKGTKAESGDFTLMCYTMAGRAMITLENDESSVTVLTDESSQRPCMGFRGIDATAPDAIGLLRKARELWKEGWRPVEDTGVTLAVPMGGGNSGDEDEESV